MFSGLKSSTQEFLKITSMEWVCNSPNMTLVLKSANISMKSEGKLWRSIVLNSDLIHVDSVTLVKSVTYISISIHSSYAKPVMVMVAANTICLKC